MGALGPGYRHSVISLDGEYGAGELLDSRVDWSALEAPPRAGSWSTTRALKRRFDGLSPDLVCTYNWGAIDGLLAAAWSGGAGILHHEDGFGAEEALGPKRRRTWMRRLVLGRSHGILVPSQTLMKIATERWHQPAQRVHHIPIGIHIEDFPLADGNRPLRAELGIPDEAWVVGSVGHLRPEKNPVRLVESFAQLAVETSPHLLMLGEGGERDALQACVARLGLGSRVTLAGYQSAPARFYRAMDCLAISSDTEQMPVNLLEAMAAGLPVVSTDVGDVRQMLPAAQARYVVPIDRSNEAATCRALGQALAELAGDALQARELGQANHEQLRANYSFEGMIKRFESLYLSAMQAARR